MLNSYEFVQKAIVGGFPDSVVTATQKTISSVMVVEAAAKASSKTAEVLKRYAEGLKVLEQYLAQRESKTAGAASLMTKTFGLFGKTAKTVEAEKAQPVVVAFTNAATGEITYNLTEAEAVAILTGKSTFKTGLTVSFGEAEARDLWAFVVEHETLHQANPALSEQEVLARQVAGHQQSMGVVAHAVSAAEVATALAAIKEFFGIGRISKIAVLPGQYYANYNEIFAALGVEKNNVQFELLASVADQEAVLQMNDGRTYLGQDESSKIRVAQGQMGTSTDATVTLKTSDLGNGTTILVWGEQVKAQVMRTEVSSLSLQKRAVLVKRVGDLAPAAGSFNRIQLGESLKVKADVYLPDQTLGADFVRNRIVVQLWTNRSGEWQAEAVPMQLEGKAGNNWRFTGAVVPEKGGRFELTVRAKDKFVAAEEEGWVYADNARGANETNFFGNVGVVVSTSATNGKSGMKVFNTAEELVKIFEDEYKGVPEGLVFEQGGYLSKGPAGWGLVLPTKMIRLKEDTELGRYVDINYGFYGVNRKGQTGILLKMSEVVPTYSAKGKAVQNGAALMMTKFFTADEIILRNGESLEEFVLTLGHNGDLASVTAGDLRAMLEKATYVEPEIDNVTGDIVDEYIYVPLVLEIESVGSPRELLHGHNWRKQNQTNHFVHVHLPTEDEWSTLVEENIEGAVRDELNSPSDIHGLKLRMKSLNDQEHVASSIIMFEWNRRPRVLKTFVLDRLTNEEQQQLFELAYAHRTTLEKDTSEVTREMGDGVFDFYELVQKATVKGMPKELTQTI